MGGRACLMCGHTRRRVQVYLGVCVHVCGYVGMTRHMHTCAQVCGCTVARCKHEHMCVTVHSFTCRYACWHTCSVHICLCRHGHVLCKVHAHAMCSRRVLVSPCMHILPSLGIFSHNLQRPKKWDHPFLPMPLKQLAQLHQC